MVLLPDIEINEYTVLSMQDPYTLNGSLIVEIEYDDNRYELSCSSISYDWIYNRYVRLRTLDGTRYNIAYSQLDNLFYRNLDAFIANNSSNCFVGDRNWMPCNGWHNFNCHSYINLIQEQCAAIDDNSLCSVYAYDSTNRNIDILIERLRIQGRDTCYRTYSNMPSTISSSIDDLDARVEAIENEFAQYVTTTVAEERINDANSRCLSFDIFTGIDTSSENWVQSKKYIHSYNYKPEYIKYYMEDENESTLLLGAEIEVDCGGESEHHAEEVLKIITGNVIDIKNDNIETKMYCTHDGSLRNGIEFDTMPMTLKYHKERMYYEKMFDYLDQHGYKAHDTNTCGLHIHACRAYLGKTDFVQQLVITKILYILEKFNDEVCVIARRNNSYSKFIGKGKDEKEFIELYKKYKDSNKHVALNLQHKDTIEFRCFKGTLKYETFILTLEFVQNIIDFAKSISIEDIELMTWKDLSNTFSSELKQYYEYRRKLEQEKEKQKLVEQESGTRINLLGGILNISPLESVDTSIAEYIGTIPTDSAIEINAGTINALESRLEDTRNYYSFNGWSSTSSGDLNSITLSSAPAAISVSYGNSLISTELASCVDERENKINELKQKVKDIKIRLKNCRSYLVKKQLSKELCDCQKQITLLKRQITR